MILGLSSFIHTSSAGLVVDGTLAAAADEERFTREKYTAAFPEQAIRFCLRQAGADFSDVEHVAFYWDPWRALAPRLCQLVRRLPYSLAFFRGGPAPEDAIRGDFVAWRRMVGVGGALRRRFRDAAPDFRLHYIEHHMAHAASAYYPSPWDEALILSVDGTGEWSTTVLARGQGSRIEKLQEVSHPNSLGVLYGALTQYLGYRVYRDEWKVMGLAAYGRPRFADRVRRLVHQAPDGGFRLDMDYFAFQQADKRTWYGPRFVELFGAPRGLDEPPDGERFADLAASFQQVTEEVVLGLVRRLLELGGGSRRLCLAGGVALNAVANGKILAESGVEDLFVQPAAHDSGAGPGAALYVHHAVLGGPRAAPMRHVYLGPAFHESEIEAAMRERDLPYETCDDIEARVAALLAEGQVVGWFQGRMEYGPRALGNRSILADPRRAEMKDVINAKVKFRESFRPFAPAVLAERSAEFFSDARPRPFMVVVLPVRPEKRAVIPAVTHMDGTDRLQTVDRETNPRFHRLIEAFDRFTGVPVVLNTSFNLQGEPIVCSPRDAVATFLASGIDALAMGDFLCLGEPGVDVQHSTV